MSDAWTEAKLGEICKFTSGNGFSKDRQGNSSGAVPFIKVSDMNLRGNEIFISKANNWITQSEAETEYSIHPVGAVAFAKIGIALTTNRRRYITRPTVLDNNMMSATPTKAVDGRWFYSLLRTLDFNDISRGSALPYLAVSDLKNIIVPLPPLAEQSAIGTFLGGLDDKIELNRRMSETLEAMAQAIFRDWFVDFGPARRKLAGETDPVAIMGGLTPDPARATELAALFPAASEEAGQPQGWELATLADLAAHCKGSINPLAHPGVEFEHYSLPAFDTGQEPATSRGADIKSSKTPVPEGAVLLSKLNPEIPRIWLPNPPSGRQQIASTEFLIFQPLPGVGRGLLYCLFRDPTFRQILAGMVTGTSKSHQRISPPALMKTPFLIGSGEAFGAFGEFAEPLLQRVLSLRAENRTLAETRDYLLPRLMSGAVRVGDAPTVEATQ